MEPTRDTSHPVPAQSTGPLQHATSTEAPSFLVPAAPELSRPDPSMYTGPGAAAAGSTKPDITKPDALDAPFNGALQPTTPAINQGSLLDDVSSSMPDDSLPEPPKPVSRARIIGLGLVAFGLLAALFLGVRIELNKTHAQEARLTNPSAQIKNQQLPTTSLSKQLGTAQTVSAVTVNGQLQVTNSLVLQPSTITSPAVTGQMYYDSSTNTLAYYNGKHYISLQGGGNTFVTNVTNNAGNTTNVTNVTNDTFVTNVSGGGFSGTGTPGTLAMFASASTLGNSMITESGSTLNVGSGTGASTVNVQGGTGGIAINTGTVNGGSSGDITLASGASSTTAAGNVSIDTGVSTINGLNVANYGFESGIEGGFSNNFIGSYTLTQDCTVSHSGACSMKMNGSDPSGGGNFVLTQQQTASMFHVTAGHHYVFSAWVKAASTPAVIDAGLNNLNTCAYSPAVSDSASVWTNIVWSCTAPAGYTTMGFEIGFNSGAVETHYFDDITATDVSSSSSTAELNLGATNAQSVTIGNGNETGLTSILGGSGIALNSGAATTTVNTGGFTVTSAAGVSIDSGVGDTSITTSSGGGTTGRIIIESGASSTTSSGDVTVDTGQGFVAGTITSNVNFEDNTNDSMDAWFCDTVAPTNTVSHSGSYSLMVTETAGCGNWGLIQNGNTLLFPVTAGHHILLSAWVRAGTTPRSINGELTWVGMSAVPMSSVTDSTSGWTQMTLSTVVPAGVADAYVDFDAGGSPGDVHYFDDITVTDFSSSASTSALHLGDTNAQSVNIGNMNELEATTIEGGSGITMNSGAGPFTLNGGSISISGTAASSIGTSSGALTLNSGGNTNGGVVVKPGSDSITAFQVQNAAGNAAFNVDSDHGIATINSASSCGYNSYTDYLASLSPTAYWKLEDGGTTAADNSGNGDTGTLSNVTANITPGPFSCDTTHPGMAFSFASQSKVTTANFAPSPTVYSQVAMFKTSGANGILIGGSDTGGGNYDRQLEIINGKLSAYIYNGSPITLTSNVSVNDGNWHIAAVTISNSGMRLYLDGNLVASNNSSSPQVYSGSWTLGEAPSNTAFTGDMAQVAVFPSALSAIQVQTLAAFSGFYTASLASIGIGTTTPGANLDDEGTALFKNGSNSTSSFQIQNSAGVALFNADTTSLVITIAYLTVTGNITVSGHLVTGGNTPGITAGAAACTSPTVTVSGNDTSGIITITAGFPCSGSGNLATINFANAFGAPPHVILTPGNLLAAALNAYVNDSSVSANQFTFATNASPAAGNQYQWNYIAIQ